MNDIVLLLLLFNFYQKNQEDKTEATVCDDLIDK